MTKNQIEPFDQSTENVFTKCIKHILDGATGIAAANREKWTLSIGHILQSAIAGKFLSTIKDEYQQYSEDGRIKDNYEQTEQNRTCLKELLEYLEQGIPNERILEVLKRIFLIAATEKHSTRKDYLPQEYMKIATGLTSGEILLLESAYRITKTAIDSQEQNNLTCEEWSRKVAENSSLQHVDLVYRDIQSLCKKHMTSQTLTANDFQSRKLPVPYYGLTELGYKFCEYINHYEGEETEEAVRKQTIPKDGP